MTNGHKNEVSWYLEEGVNFLWCFYNLYYSAMEKLIGYMIDQGLREQLIEDYFFLFQLEGDLIFLLLFPH